MNVDHLGIRSFRGATRIFIGALLFCLSPALLLAAVIGVLLVRQNRKVERATELTAVRAVLHRQAIEEAEADRLILRQDQMIQGFCQ